MQAVRTVAHANLVDRLQKISYNNFNPLVELAQSFFCASFI